jgi:hypothetical protein
MKKFIAALYCASAMAVALPQESFAGPGVIDRACRQANRTAANPGLCRCIQKVANRELSMGERRKVAKWFSDPHRAQEVRQSDRRSDEMLWKRYKAFGAQAEQSCG